MIKQSKIAISLPHEHLKRVEKMRKELGLKRSTFIDRAISFWLDSLEEKKLIKQYEEGYQKQPESLEEIKVTGQLSAEAFKAEGLE